MTRSEQLENIRKMKEQFSLVSSQRKTEIHSFEILSEMCESLIRKLNAGEEVNYDILKKFINNKYEQIIKSSYGKR